MSTDVCLQFIFIIWCSKWLPESVRPLSFKRDFGFPVRNLTSWIWRIVWLTFVKLNRRSYNCPFFLSLLPWRNSTSTGVFFPLMVVRWLWIIKAVVGFLSPRDEVRWFVYSSKQQRRCFSTFGLDFGLVCQKTEDDASLEVVLLQEAALVFQVAQVKSWPRYWFQWCFTLYFIVVSLSQVLVLITRTIWHLVLLQHGFPF